MLKRGDFVNIIIWFGVALELELWVGTHIVMKTHFLVKFDNLKTVLVLGIPGHSGHSIETLVTNIFADLVVTPRILDF